MMEIFRQGLGKPMRQEQQRRVDIGRGRVIVRVESEKADMNREQPRTEADHRPLISILFVLSLLFAAVMLSGCASPVKKQPATSIQIESVRMTAAGHYIDLRYRVLDPARANESLGPGVKPVLIDELTGATMAVPMTAKLGSLRQTRGDQRTDRSYFVLFANTAGVRSGSSVTAQIGDMRFENLTIE